MNIKEAERMTGLKKANIRYYEQEGLLQPKRNGQNNYREYDQQNIETLERIKLLRLLEVPVFQIQALQKGETTLHNVIDLQEKKFSEEIREKEELLKLCKRVKMDCSNFESLTVIASEGNGEYWHRMNGKIFVPGQNTAYRSENGSVKKFPSTAHAFLLDRMDNIPDCRSPTSC